MCMWSNYSTAVANTSSVLILYCPVVLPMPSKPWHTWHCTSAPQFHQHGTLSAFIYGEHVYNSLINCRPILSKECYSKIGFEKWVSTIEMRKWKTVWDLFETVWANDLGVFIQPTRHQSTVQINITHVQSHKLSLTRLIVFSRQCLFCSTVLGLFENITFDSRVHQVELGTAISRALVPRG